jgi:ADP-ribose pyrophosphatase YjhB (NUDIX family)
MPAFDKSASDKSASSTSTTPPRRRSPLLWLLQKHWRMSRALTLGGQVCVIDDQGRVLLIRHGYRPGWHFPGGGVEKGENVRDAAVRELEEETGIVARETPSLHGIFNNQAAFPGDHIALFVVRAFTTARAPKPGLEIAEQGFFATQSLPVETTAGTRRRIAEIFDGALLTQEW